jgi:large subunit ribosomal protein L15
MSVLSKIKPAKGSTHHRKRVGRGIGSGLGGYSGKGGKGQTQRSGGSIRRGFEGGQTPLHRRLPKFGFTNVAFAREYDIVNLDQLSNLGPEISPEVLKKAGLISRLDSMVKILSRGDWGSKATVKAHLFSKKAVEKIEKAGGKVEVLK